MLMLINILCEYFKLFYFFFFFLIFKKTKQADEDVAKAIATFASSGKLPANVMEATWVFQILEKIKIGVKCSCLNKEWNEKC